jgi:hypothetical protein
MGVDAESATMKLEKQNLEAKIGGIGQESLYRERRDVHCKS